VAPETRLCEFVLPADTNHLGTLYGGTLLAWMDKAAGVAAIRRAGGTVVTAAIDGLSFRVPIHEGELVELLAEVESVGRTSLRVQVEVHVEDPAARSKELCTVGTFTMVAVDDAGRPRPIEEGSGSPPSSPGS
jgi:acyl-CoA hydrolase